MRNTRLIRNSLRSAMGLSLTACLSLFSLTANAAGAESPAALLGFQRIGDTLEFTVISTGCTTEDHFRLDVAPTESNDDAATSDNKKQAVTLTLVRTKADRCKRMPGPRVISLDIPDQYTSNTVMHISNAFVALRPRG